jgi:hypothetical protein
MTIEQPDRNPTAHLAIAGTGRAGTSFLVRYLTELGLDTHLARHGEKDSWDEYANAGLETVPLASASTDLPYVVKYPWLHQCIDHILTNGTLRFDAVIIPVRDLVEAAISRTLVELQAMHRTVPWMVEMDQSWEVWGGTPGGLTYSLNPLDQGRLLAVGFHHLVDRLTRADIPIFLLAFPRLVEDSHYLFRKLRPLLPAVVSEDVAATAHARVRDLTKVRVQDENAAVVRSDASREGLLTEPCNRVAQYAPLDRLEAIAVRRELVRVRMMYADMDAAAEAARKEAVLAKFDAAGTKEELRAVRSALERAGQTLRAETDQRAKDAARLREQLAAVTAQRDYEIAQLQEQLNAASEQRQREVAQLNEEVAAATEQRQREVAQLNEEVAAATEQRQREVAQLNEEVAAATEQRQREVAQLNEEVAAATEQRQREVAQLNEEVAVATERREHEVKLLGEQVAAATEQREREVALLHGQLVGVAEQHELEVTQLREQVDATRLAAARLERDLDIVYSSRSWRLTGSYRAIGRAIELMRMGRRHQ